MRVLVACEFSGIVRDAFAARGHDAWSCDLLPTETTGQHLIMDNDMHLKDTLYEQYWDLLIAHPPCTHLAVSGSRWFKEKVADGRQQHAIIFFMMIANSPVKKICIENPISIMSSVWRKPDQIINPYFFGDSVPKKTCLWLKVLPLLYHNKSANLFDEKITHVKPEYIIYNSKKNKSGKSKYSVFGKMASGHGHEKSRTFNGIATAMAEQWG